MMPRKTAMLFVIAGPVPPWSQATGISVEVENATGTGTSVTV